MGKRGQITLFLIVGLVLIMTLGVMIYLSLNVNRGVNEDSADANMAASDLDQVKNYVDNCVKQTSLEGLSLIGRQAGYASLPSTIKFYDTGYWFLDQINIQPSLDETRRELEKYVNLNLPKCVNSSYLAERGFDIKSGKPNTTAYFNFEDVSIVVKYPIDVTKSSSVRNYEEFSVNLNIHYRKIFELASQIINKQLDTAFNFSDPLLAVNKFGFDISYKHPDTETIVYTIRDYSDDEDARNFAFSFASRFKRSSLTRTLVLQNNSNTIPTVFANIVYSVDRMAELYIMPGVTMSKNGSSVDAITVQQFYPKNITRLNVPMHELADDSVTLGEKTWKIRYPVYQFEPTGMRFNTPQRLVLYWDEARNPHKDKLGIIYDDGTGPRPLQSKVNYEEHYVYTDIPGFSNYTIADCGDLEATTVSATAKISSSAGCWLKMIIIIVIIIIIIILTWGAGSVLLAPATGAAAATGTASVGLTFGTAWTAGLAATGFTGAAGIAGAGAAGIFVAAGTALTTAAVVAGAVVGGAYIGNSMMFTSEKDTISFTPLCDQTVTITSEFTGDKGSGECMPEGDRELGGGTPFAVTAVVKKCKKWGFACGSCEQKCETKYK